MSTLIRHGEVETRYHRSFGGSRIDLELSPAGHAQAQRLGIRELLDGRQGDILNG